jgi:hypothetical protein
MEISVTDVLRRISRFKGMDEYSRAVFWLEMTYHLNGPKAAMHHARRIEAAYKALRSDRIAKREAFLRDDATRRGLVIA